jgi:hypothetical protein
MTIPHWILVTIRNGASEGYRENQNTHFMCSNFSENRAVYKIMWKNTVQPDRPQMPI